MSAYVVSDNHISALVGAMANNGVFTPSSAEIKRVGQLLLDANIDSVANRYDEVGEVREFVLTKEFLHRKEPIYYLKAAECYESQTENIPGWRETEASNLIESLRGQLIRKLPGYDQIKWGIDG
jgi:hypothetical protein